MENSPVEDQDVQLENQEAKEGNTTIFEEDTTFKELGVCDELCDACTRLNFKFPTKIQKEVLPYGLQGKDIIGLAETGSGKTLAFGIPIVQSLLENPQSFFALILAPTRELCVQIRDQLDALGASISLKSCVIVGGLDPMSQAIALSKKPHISKFSICARSYNALVIGTPGRLLYHLENTKGFALKNLRYLVFDEADKLLNMDFEKEIDKILEVIPKKRNTYLFSATMTNKVSKLQRASLNDPVKLEVSSKYQTVSTLSQNYIFIPAKYKECYLTYLLNEFAGNSTIIFINTCMNAIKLVLMLRNLGFAAIGIHGKLNQVNRLGALNKFKTKEKNILIATDVASRGLDIPSVDLVINFDIPQSSKEYVHRVGRTARAGKAGKAISMVTQYDIENFQKIEFLLGKKLDLFPTEEEEVLVFNERVQEAQRIATQSFKEMIDKKMSKGDDSDDEGKGRRKSVKRIQNDKRPANPAKQKQLKKHIKFDI